MTFGADPHPECGHRNGTLAWFDCPDCYPMPDPADLARLHTELDKCGPDDPRTWGCDYDGDAR